MDIVIGSEIEIEKPRKEVINFCEKNLIVNNPDYGTKRRLGLWLGDTPEYLYLYRINENKVVIPVGAFSYIKKYITSADKVLIKLADSQEFDFHADVDLYDYQRKAVSQMIKIGFGILWSAAGSGKTQMGIALACKLGYKTLWLTHTQDLLKQSYDRARRYISESALGKITGGKIDIRAGITFATVQTMSKTDLNSLKYEFNTIIVDECHRAVGSPTKITQFGKVLSSLAARHKFGLSATVHRADGLIKCCFALLGNIGYMVPDEAIADKIMQVRVIRRNLLTLPSEMYLDGSGMIVFSYLIKYLVENRNRNIEIVADLKRNRGRSCLILSDRVIHLEFLKTLLSSNEAVLISGKTNKKAREQAIEDMRTGKMKYLFATYSLAKEGLDIPCLDRLFLTTPHSDYAVIVQAVGRIARTAKGKGEPVCYDYVDENISYLVKKFNVRCTHYRKARCVL